ncbi:small ribosomal subunit protein mS37-like [Amphiura filiformis]|uniref:small ribosomal subunit protein mS37-like n=1 Tax=Amphiura filiformis TaxID=82378 RepID=UPI003B220E78
MSKRLRDIAVRNLYKPGQRLPAIGKPFALKDRVGEKSRVKEESPCLAEMSTLLDCWKSNNFSDISCASEVTKFQRCLAKARANKGQASERLTSKEMNEMLKKNPLPRS